MAIRGENVSAGIDFSWERKQRRLYVCLVLFKDPKLASKISRFLLEKIRDRHLHFRRLTSRKKKFLLNAVDNLLSTEIFHGFSREDICVLEVTRSVGSSLVRKYSWIEEKITDIISTAKQYRNYPHQVFIGSDLERGEYSFYRNLLSRLESFHIDVYVDDKRHEVRIADAIVNYARKTGKLITRKHFC